ncbi:MAG: hypothetical protein RL391_1778 [Actinomycetota bacterium]|jgi:uncharacterized protein (TIGR03084 family)
MSSVLADLAAEHSDLDGVVATIGEPDWRRPTPATSWTIADSVGHVAFFDERARLAITDPAEFAADRERLIAAAPHDPSVDFARSVPGHELLARWRRERALLIEAARVADPEVRVPWYGPAMSLRSFLTARLMETWAHGQDVADALGVERVPTDRLRHVCHIGMQARRYSLMINRLPSDDTEVSVVLRAPSGESWTWGPAEAAGGSVVGEALEFCLVVVQRRHLADTSLVVSGDSARRWMSVAQAFAGPPGPGRASVANPDRD